METKLEKNLPFEVVGTTVYQLEFDSYRKGGEQMRNRVYANVQGYRDTPVEELEATARLFSAAPELLEALQDLVERCKDFPIITESAKAAIDKALGETK